MIGAVFCCQKNDDGLVDAAAIGLIPEFAIRIIFIRNDAVIGHRLDLLEEFSRLARIRCGSFLCSEIKICGSGLCLAKFIALLSEDFDKISWRLGAFLDGSGEIEILHIYIYI